MLSTSLSAQLEFARSRPQSRSMHVFFSIIKNDDKPNLASEFYRMSIGCFDKHESAEESTNKEEMKIC